MITARSIRASRKSRPLVDPRGELQVALGNCDSLWMWIESCTNCFHVLVLTGKNQDHQLVCAQSVGLILFQSIESDVERLESDVDGVRRELQSAGPAVQLLKDALTDCTRLSQHECTGRERFELLPGVGASGNLNAVALAVTSDHSGRG
jgi:hypothetical protein